MTSYSVLLSICVSLPGSFVLTTILSEQDRQSVRYPSFIESKSLENPFAFLKIFCMFRFASHHRSRPCPAFTVREKILIRQFLERELIE